MLSRLFANCNPIQHSEKIVALKICSYAYNFIKSTTEGHNENSINLWKSHLKGFGKRK